MKCKDFNFVRYFKPVIYLITGFLLTEIAFGQSYDSLKRSESRILFVPGVKIYMDRNAPEIRTHLILGVELYMDKKQRVSISYRNSLGIEATPKDTIFNKNLNSFCSTNTLNLNFKTSFKKSFLKIGIGPYQERRQSSFDQQFILIVPYYYGLDFSVYTKLDWINLGYRQQIGLFANDYKNISLLEIYRFSVCLEFPLNIK